MKLQKISLAFLLMMVPVAMVTGAWVWESAENLCAGIQKPCTDGPSCTRVALGPCKGSETKQPESFLTTEMIASGALDLDKYLSCNSNTDGTCEHAELTVFTGPGFRDGRAGLTTDDGGGKKTKLIEMSLFDETENCLTHFFPSTYSFVTSIQNTDIP